MWNVLFLTLCTLTDVPLKELDRRLAEVEGRVGEISTEVSVIPGMAR